MKMDCVLYEARAGPFYVMFTPIRKGRVNVLPKALLRLRRDLNFGLKKLSRRGSMFLEVMK